MSLTHWPSPRGHFGFRGASSLLGASCHLRRRFRLDPCRTLLILTAVGSAVFEQSLRPPSKRPCLSADH
eukprot:14741582-Alexandrium_andersonii.AAC.1